MMRRRELLLGAVGAGATSCAGVLPAAQADTPVMRLFREWEAAYAASCDCEGGDDEVDRLSAIYIDIEDRMLSTPAQTMQDVFAKVWAYTSEGKFLLPERSCATGAAFWAEAEKALIA